MSTVEALTKRRSRRLPIPGIRVEVTPEGSSEPAWSCDAIDINGDGLALILPSDVAVGTPLELSFEPDELTHFRSVPCRVVRQDAAGGYGAVEFQGWREQDLIGLWTFLVSRLTL